MGKIDRNKAGWKGWIAFITGSARMLTGIVFTADRGRFASFKPISSED